MKKWYGTPDMKYNHHQNMIHLQKSSVVNIASLMNNLLIKIYGYLNQIYNFFLNHQKD